MRIAVLVSPPRLLLAAGCGLGLPDADARPRVRRVASSAATARRSRRSPSRPATAERLRPRAGPKRSAIPRAPAALWTGAATVRAGEHAGRSVWQSRGLARHLIASGRRARSHAPQSTDARADIAGSSSRLDDVLRRLDHPRLFVLDLAGRRGRRPADRRVLRRDGARRRRDRSHAAATGATRCAATGGCAIARSIYVDLALIDEPRHGARPATHAASSWHCRCSNGSCRRAGGARRGRRCRALRADGARRRGHGRGARGERGAPAARGLPQRGRC